MNRFALTFSAFMAGVPLAATADVTAEFQACVGNAAMLHLGDNVMIQQLNPDTGDVTVFALDAGPTRTYSVFPQTQLVRFEQVAEEPDPENSNRAIRHVITIQNQPVGAINEDTLLRDGFDQTKVEQFKDGLQPDPTDTAEPYSQFTRVLGALRKCF